MNDILTPDEVRALIAATPSRSATGRRNRALIVALYRGGLRLSEALALLPEDVDVEEGVLSIAGRSVTSRRRIGLDPQSREVLAAWAVDREDLGLRDEQPFFSTLRGEPIKDAYVRALLPRLAAAAGLAKRVHASGLRASHALELAGEGFPLRVVQEHLGIESLAAAQRYLERYRPVDPVRAIQSRDWAIDA
ncbi:MAG: site-specific integrase [Actinomycetota bacterium]